METKPATPTFPAEVYQKQAKYLSQTTAVTTSEALAYLKHRHSSDEKPDYELANELGVTAGTFSQQLSSAKEKLESDSRKDNALKQALAVTPIGGSNGHSREVIAIEDTYNALAILDQTEFYDQDDYNFACKYRLHLLYRDTEPNVDFDELPDDILHYTKYAVFTIEADTKDHLRESAVAYLDVLDTTDKHDVLSIKNMIDEAI